MPDKTTDVRDIRPNAVERLEVEPVPLDKPKRDRGAPGKELIGAARAVTLKTPDITEPLKG